MLVYLNMFKSRLENQTLAVTPYLQRPSSLFYRPFENRQHTCQNQLPSAQSDIPLYNKMESVFQSSFCIGVRRVSFSVYDEGSGTVQWQTRIHRFSLPVLVEGAGSVRPAKMIFFTKVLLFLTVCLLGEVLSGYAPLSSPAPKKNFTGEYSLKFVFDPDWNNCFAYKIKKTNLKKTDFLSRDACYQKQIISNPDKCLGVGNTMSANYTLKRGATADKLLGLRCNKVTCPKGYECKVRFETTSSKSTPQCCSIRFQKAFNNKKCPNGADADLVDERGAMQMFVPIVGHNCNDFICHTGYKCIQLNKQFAKCCKA
ncbi:hypothetical protein L596_012397 [Steinernema carpocapsae]|uniref:BPTI/Kunitz inhibitor domain-containing protein n=1 Tax=Steinernema carpocapsae TaxID=34508 RepID=A0A4V6A4S5_STECR|nr:hypothetical protein L596_012397 [Steinernema carpocapsae]